jgi:hypothetical protein
MTKKHLIKLADAVKQMPRHDDGETVEFAAVLQTLADFCSEQNPRFNRSRWMSYIAGECGPNGGTIR